MEIHGHAFRGAKTPLYIVYRNLVARCQSDSENYGGRGITICEEWKDNFLAFKDWAESSGYAEHLFLDRKNNNGNYSPENCRWVSRTVNNRNRRNCHWWHINGQWYTSASEAGKSVGKAKSTIQDWCGHSARGRPQREGCHTIPKYNPDGTYNPMPI